MDLENKSCNFGLATAPAHSIEAQLFNDVVSTCTLKLSPEVNLNDLEVLTSDEEQPGAALEVKVGTKAQKAEKQTKSLIKPASAAKVASPSLFGSAAAAPATVEPVAKPSLQHQNLPLSCQTSVAKAAIDTATQEAASSSTIIIKPKQPKAAATPQSHKPVEPKTQKSTPKATAPASKVQSQSSGAPADVTPVVAASTKTVFPYPEEAETARKPTSKPAQTQPKHGQQRKGQEELPRESKSHADVVTIKTSELSKLLAESNERLAQDIVT